MNFPEVNPDKYGPVLPQTEPRRVGTYEHVELPAIVEGTKEEVPRTTEIMELLFAHHSRTLKLFLMVLVFLTALYTKAYTGAFEAVIHNHIGGVMYVLFGSLLLSLLFPLLPLTVPVLGSLALTSFLEFVQWLHLPWMVAITRHPALAYLFGNSYNPVDFIYYGIGGAAGLLLLWVIRHE